MRLPWSGNISTHSHGPLASRDVPKRRHSCFIFPFALLMWTRIDDDGRKGEDELRLACVIVKAAREAFPRIAIASENERAMRSARPPGSWRNAFLYNSSQLSQTRETHLRFATFLCFRSNKYLQKSSISRVCAVGGFFISIPVFLTGKRDINWITRIHCCASANLAESIIGLRKLLLSECVKICRIQFQLVSRDDAFLILILLPGKWKKRRLIQHF